MQMQKLMSISDIKMYVMSFSVVGITTFAQIEDWLKIQAWWCLFECWWNSVVAKLMFNVETCPHKLCKCKK